MTKILLIIGIMPPRRVGTRANSAESVNQNNNDRGSAGHEERDDHDPEYNDFDEEDYKEEEAEDTQMGENLGGNPIDQFMHLL